MLQWLVTHHQAHTSHPALLVFSVLPHHTYQIYQATLQALDPTTVASLPWLKQFLQTCVPTNQRTLHKEVATSMAFLRYLATQLGLLGEQVAAQPETRIHRQATLCLSALLGGLTMLGSPGEERVHCLLQLVLAGLKSGHPELQGLASILLSCLLSR